MNKNSNNIRRNISNTDDDDNINEEEYTSSTVPSSSSSSLLLAPHTTTTDSIAPQVLIVGSNNEGPFSSSISQQQQPQQQERQSLLETTERSDSSSSLLLDFQPLIKTLVKMEQQENNNSGNDNNNGNDSNRGDCKGSLGIGNDDDDNGEDNDTEAAAATTTTTDDQHDFLLSKTLKSPLMPGPDEQPSLQQQQHQGEEQEHNGSDGEIVLSIVDDNDGDTNHNVCQQQQQISSLLSPSQQQQQQEMCNIGDNNISSLSRTYTKFVIKNKYIILLLFLVIIIPYGFISLKKLMRLIKTNDESTTFLLPIIKDTLSYESQIKFSSLYEGKDWLDPTHHHPMFIVVLEKRTETMTTTTINNTTNNKEEDSLINEISSPKTVAAASKFSLRLQQYLFDTICDWNNNNNTNNNDDEKKTIMIFCSENNKTGTTNTTNKSNTTTNDTLSSSSSFDVNEKKMIRVMSYYSLANDANKLTMLGKELFVSNDEQTTMIQIQYLLPSSLEGKQMLANTIKDYGRNYTHTFCSSSPSSSSSSSSSSSCYFNVSHTGMIYLQNDLLQSTHNDLYYMSIVVVPIVLFLFGMALLLSLPSSQVLTQENSRERKRRKKSNKNVMGNKIKSVLFILIIPFICIVYTICTWSIIMFNIVRRIVSSNTSFLSPFTPSIMLSLTLGIGITYTLFFLSRYLEEEEKNERKEGTTTNETNSDTANVNMINENDDDEENKPSSPSSSSLSYNGSIADNDNGSSKREKQQQQQQLPRISHMVHHGGFVVGTSGIILICTFGCLTLLPFPMLQSLGIGSAVAIGCSVLVTFIVVPAILATNIGLWALIATIDNYNGNESQDLRRKRQRQDHGHHHHQEESTDNSLNEPLLYPNMTTSVESALQTHHRQRSQDNADVNVNDRNDDPDRARLILVLIFIVLLPVARYANQIKFSISFGPLLPSFSSSLQTYESLEENFGLSPYHILFDGNEADVKMDSKVGFDIMHLVVDNLETVDNNLYGLPSSGLVIEEDSVNEGERHGSLLSVDTNFSCHDGLNVFIDDCREDSTMHTLNVNNATTTATTRKTQYAGIAVVGQQRIRHSVYVSAKVCAQVHEHCPIELLRSIDFIDKEVSSNDHYATYITTTLGVDPFSGDGVRWLHSARDVVSRLEATGELQNVKIYIEGGGAIAHDGMKAVYSAFPRVITINVIAVFLLIGLLFRSIVTPLRSFLSVNLTLGFVFGLSVVAYQHGILNWMGVDNWRAVPPNEIYWLTPVMAFSVIIALTVNNDVFLTSRMIEFRSKGYGHDSSVIAGLYSSGRIQTAAGLTMAIAFGGLMLSSSPALCEWSFLLTVTVLLDTFVIRMLVVPIVIGIISKCN